MKKIIIALALLLIPISAGASFDSNLYYGLQNDSGVRELQEFLTAQGTYSGPITGNFYSLTMAGVKAFQQREGISPTSGYFGPLTRTRANQFLSADVEASNQQAVQETGSTPPTPTPSATTNDVVAQLQAQIAVLMQQLQAMQMQQTSVQQLQQTVQQQAQTIQQIQQNTQQIVQNTTPAPTPKIKGCMDITAVNYNSSAEENEGCIYSNLVLTTEESSTGFGTVTYHKFIATGERFKFIEMVLSVTNMTPDGIWWGGHSWTGGQFSYGNECSYIDEYPNTVPSKCSENKNYFFSKSTNFVNDSPSGYQLTLPVGETLFGRTDNFQIISAIFKGETTGKIITLP